MEIVLLTNLIKQIAATGTTITTNPHDGTKTTENKDGTWIIVFPKKPDGSVDTYYSDGRTVTKYSDGRIVTH
jgi:hypothetical protein